ncbi:MAG: heparin lyase I family protein [Chloroflexi bacterium]|nr:heparin lyase I family protein [Chloroflexota bacterium]
MTYIMPSLKYRSVFVLLSPLIIVLPPPAAHAQTSTWFDELPPELRQSILWYADHESGNLHQWTDEGWEYEGGDIYPTGPADEAFAELTTHVAKSGNASVAATIRNAYRAENGNRAVRLMRWTDRAWDNGGQYFPLQAYYSTWIYMPYAYNPTKYAPWDPGDGGWWNIFQFKSNDESGESQPVWTVNVANDGAFPYLYLYSKYNPPHSYDQANPIAFPIGRWVHLEAYYRQSSTNTGVIRLWQDGRLIFDVENVVTILADHVVWGIGNYTDHIAGGPVEGEATLYFDDAAVSRKRLSAAHEGLTHEDTS